ncbi:MAG: tRNA (adenosine(37)-N6)-threonylcarbamoyltransferase complex transferase subunit TsaD [Candidatus Firestonebacteria bacterium]|nr:tRNA (adenosine(37)-N6)-threonylcarbamoyltransferase complex transferase subunit TsaD [Candidatus Firestonebacteria bacterium]
MYILGIETSCDETSASIVKDGRQILSNIISSQQKTHEKFGGIVPELASRNHLENISFVVRETFDEAKIKPDKIAKIAVTYAPGLVGSLLVGISFAKAYAYALDIPLLGVHHLYGHICATFIEHEPSFPALALVVSGGHTCIFYMNKRDEAIQIASTRDDACGEVFDKIARELELGYPGGPVIDKLSKLGNPDTIKFPLAKLKHGNQFDFSYSGLKTSVLNVIRNKNFKKEDILASFQKTAIDLLYRNTYELIKIKKVKTLLISGGVACNSCLREKFNTLTQEGYSVYFPSPILCTDNAAMIAASGYYLPLTNEKINLSLNAVPNMELRLG